MRKMLVLVGAICVLFCGCSQSKEIDERNFVLSFGVDKGYEGKFDVSMGVGNSPEGEIKNASEKTLAKAMKESETKYSRSLYYGHTKTILLSKEILENKEAVVEIVATLMADKDLSLKALVLCADGSAKECIEKVQKEDRGDGLYIWDYYKNNGTEVENTITLTLKELEEGVREKATLVIPTIRAGEEKVVIGGGVVFNGEEVSGELTEEELVGYSFIVKNCKGFLLESQLQGEELAFLIKKSSCTTAKENGEIVLLIEVMGEVKTAIGSDTLEKAEKSLEKTIEGIVEKGVSALERAEVKELQGKKIRIKVNCKIDGTGVIK